MAGKGREKIKLVSQGKTQKQKPTGTYYTTTVNKASRVANKKLLLKKFDKRAWVNDKQGGHVEFKEERLK
jgi:ribosomal protein L33